MGEPYRTAAYPSINDVYPEMLDALKFLKKFEKFKPVIAGGALWSWAAYKPARDIDIFVKSSWRTRRRARKFTGILSNDFLPRHSLSQYGFESEDSDATQRYFIKLDETGKDIDLVLTSWRNLDVINHFDYYHCSVAFGPHGCSSQGADFYANGQLVKRYSSLARSDKIVLSKVQKELWGNPEAVDRLELVLKTLHHTYIYL